MRTVDTPELPAAIDFLGAAHNTFLHFFWVACLRGAFAGVRLDGGISRRFGWGEYERRSETVRVLCNAI